MPALIVEGFSAMVRGLAQEGAVVRFPALERWLNHGERLQWQACDAETLFWRLLTDDNSPPPVAALTRWADCPDDAAGHWLRADPVWLRADISRVFLAACGNLRMTDTERRALLETLRPWLAERELRFDAPHPQRWYVRVPREPELDLPNPVSVLGRDLAEVLPTTPESRHWHSLLNETQMLLFQHPVNEQRRAAGQAEVNSLWFWGGGELPAGLDLTYTLDTAFPAASDSDAAASHSAANNHHFAADAAYGTAGGHVLLRGLQCWRRATGQPEPPAAAAPLWHWQPYPGETPAQALGRLETLAAAMLRHPAARAGAGLLTDEGVGWRLPPAPRLRFLHPKHWRRLRPLTQYCMIKI